MFWSICLVFCPTRKSLDWDLWVSGSLNKNMIDAGVGAVVGPEREKQKINKTERWARLVTHTGHSVLSQECVRGILTITNVGLTAGWLFPWLYDLHFVHGNIMGLGDSWHYITSDMWTMSKYDGEDKVLCNHLINNVVESSTVQKSMNKDKYLEFDYNIKLNISKSYSSLWQSLTINRLRLKIQILWQRWSVFAGWKLGFRIKLFI